jgi:hypothetical protein
VTSWQHCQKSSCARTLTLSDTESRVNFKRLLLVLVDRVSQMSVTSRQLGGNPCTTMMIITQRNGLPIMVAYATGR